MALTKAQLATALLEIHKLTKRTQHKHDGNLQGWEPVATHRIEQIAKITKQTLRKHLYEGNK